MENIFPKIAIFLLCFCAGCAWLKGGEKSAGGLNAAVPETLSSGLISEGKVVNASALARGGRLLVVPFTAGAGVEANEELDRATLMIIKGMADTLGENDPSFEVLSGEDASMADFILRGHVIRYRKPSILRRWVMRDRRARLEVEGRLLNARSKETILLFAHARERAEGAGADKDLGYAIGEDLGRFLLSAGDRPGVSAVHSP